MCLLGATLTSCKPKLVFEHFGTKLSTGYMDRSRVKFLWRKLYVFITSGYYYSASKHVQTNDIEAWMIPFRLTESLILPLLLTELQC